MLTATCPLCEASCGILVDTDGEHVRSIRGDEDDPISRGYICPKASALADLHDDPDRVRAPLIREGSRWREVSWSEALDRAARGLVRVRQENRPRVVRIGGVGTKDNSRTRNRDRPCLETRSRCHRPFTPRHCIDSNSRSSRKSLQILDKRRQPS